MLIRLVEVSPFLLTVVVEFDLYVVKIHKVVVEFDLYVANIHKFTPLFQCSFHLINPSIHLTSPDLALLEQSPNNNTTQNITVIHVGNTTINQPHNDAPLKRNSMNIPRRNSSLILPSSVGLVFSNTSKSIDIPGHLSTTRLRLHQQPLRPFNLLSIYKTTVNIVSIVDVMWSRVNVQFCVDFVGDVMERRRKL